MWTDMHSYIDTLMIVLNVFYSNPYVYSLIFILACPCRPCPLYVFPTNGLHLFLIIMMNYLHIKKNLSRANKL